MPEISKADYEALARFRLAIRQFLAVAEDGALESGLTPQQHQTLLAIKGRPEKDWASVSEIAEFLLIRHHAAVGLVDRCERAGLVSRNVHPTDRRLVRVSLTARGDQLLDTISRRTLAELQALRSLVDIEHLESVAEKLREAASRT